MMSQVLLSVVVSGLACCLGCDREPPSAPSSTGLDDALRNSGQEDLVAEENGTRDTILYSGNGTSVWLRRMLPSEPDGILYVPEGKKSGALYAIAQDRCLCAIPVDISDPPFAPLVHPMRDGGILIISYTFGRGDARAPGQAEYEVSLYIIQQRSCRRIMNTAFKPMKLLAEDSVAVFRFMPFRDPFGRLFVAKTMWRSSGPGQAPTALSAAVEECYVWDQKTGHFLEAKAGFPAAQSQE